MSKYKDLPEILHDWYLEAIKYLNPKDYNPNANKSWDDLNPEQRYIDEYIARRIKETYGILPEINHE